MELNKNLPYYSGAVVIFLLLKFSFTQADNDSLAFLLAPTDKFVCLLTGSSSIYLPENGFYHDNLNILIDKSCSGFNFWILCFLMFTYIIVKHVDKPDYKILAIPSALLSAYLLTIVANASRIYTSIIAHNLTKLVLPNQQQLIHEAVGIVTNLLFLVLTYNLIDILIHYKRPNEKLA